MFNAHIEIDGIPKCRWETDNAQAANWQLLPDSVHCMEGFESQLQSGVAEIKKILPTAVVVIVEGPCPYANDYD